MTPPIYTPKGRAREYARLALNVYQGCSHRCVYCYAPSATFTARQIFEQAKVRLGLLDNLETQARQWQREGKTGQVLLSFACDPYQPLDEREQQTRQAIRILHDHDFTVSLLTKGGSRALRDVDLLTDRDAFGVTLTLFDPGESREWEPGAATPGERLQSLNVFHRAQVPTWASLEPVICPETTLGLIRLSHYDVDFFKVGKLNYEGRLPEHLREQVKGIDWAKFANDAYVLLHDLGYREYDADMPIMHGARRFYIKQDLARYL